MLGGHKEEMTAKNFNMYRVGQKQVHSCDYAKQSLFLYCIYQVLYQGRKDGKKLSKMSRVVIYDWVEITMDFSPHFSIFTVTFNK